MSPVPVAGAVSAALVCAAALTGVAACTAETDPTPQAPAQLDGVAVTVVQQRLDEGSRRIGIQVATDADTSVHVRGVQLSSAAFEPVPVTVKDTVFGPGQVIDLTTRYGDAECGREDPAAGLAASLTVQSAGGVRVVEVPVTGPGVGLVRRLHAAQCASRALLQAAVLSYDETFARARVAGEEVLVGALLLRRPAAGGSRQRVVVDSLSGSVLFDVEDLDPPEPGPVARLGPVEDGLRLPVQIASSGRCDEHARSQSTQTFLFSAFVRVGSSAEHREILVPPAALQRQALRLLDDVC